MIKNFKNLILSLLCLLVVTGCATSQVQFVNQNAKSQELNSKDIMFGNVLQALELEDYALIKNQLSDDLRVELTEDSFKHMVDNLKKSGKITQITYLDHLKYPVIASELWKISFEKENEEKVIEYREKLVKIMYTTLDNRIQIVAISVQ